MSKTRKSITFDIDTKIGNIMLGDYRKAHAAIQIFFERKHGFFHPEGSVYESPNPLTYTEVKMLVQDLINTYPYLSKCIRDMRATNIPTVHTLNNMLQYDGTPFFNKGPKLNDNNNCIEEPKLTDIDFLEDAAQQMKEFKGLYQQKNDVQEIIEDEYLNLEEENMRDESSSLG